MTTNTTTTHIPSALNSFTGALTAANCAKTDLHNKHLAASAAGTSATALETEKLLKAVGSAEKTGFATLTANLGIVDVATGASTADPAANEATVKVIDAQLAALEASQKALDAARANTDAVLTAARNAALEARAKLAPKAPEKK